MRGPPVPATTPSGSALPPALRVRLYELFVQIEREFEVLYAENLGLQERVDWLSSEQQQQQMHQLTQQHHHQLNNSLRATNEHLDITPTPSSAAMTSIMNTMTASLPKGMSRGIYAHKIRYCLTLQLNKISVVILFDFLISTAEFCSFKQAFLKLSYRSHTNKLRQQTNRIMSNLKGPPTINCIPLRRYSGHKDGVWEVSVSRMGLPIIGTASADHTAIIWGMHSGRPLLQYTGHTGLKITYSQTCVQRPPK
jgi:hypothetical protein